MNFSEQERNYPVFTHRITQTPLYYGVSTHFLPDFTTFYHYSTTLNHKITNLKKENQVVIVFGLLLSTQGLLVGAIL